MMNVQRMRQIVDVTADGGLPLVALDAAGRWQGKSLTHVRSSGNHIFRLVQTDGAIGYLRLTPVAERSRASLDAELEFVQHVARAGVAVARPIPSESGSLVEEVHDRGTSTNATNDTTAYHAVVFEGLRGRQLEHDELTEPHYRAWGKTLAQLHDASQTFGPRASRAPWLEEIHRVRASLPDSDEVVARVLNEGAAWLKTMPSNPESYGLLHGDCELDNLVWDGDEPQVLDFDSAVYAPYHSGRRYRAPGGVVGGELPAERSRRLVLRWLPRASSAPTRIPGDVAAPAQIADGLQNRTTAQCVRPAIDRRRGDQTDSRRSPMAREDAGSASTLARLTACVSGGGVKGRVAARRSPDGVQDRLPQPEPHFSRSIK